MDDKTRDALSKPFTGDIVRQKKGQGGRLMDYVSHGGVTKRLNEVAPDWEATMVERFIVGDGDKLHCLGGVMRLTIGGVTREEAGGPARLTTLADDLKNTYSDCLKRCAMRFGVALDLWESAEEHDEDAQPEAAASPAPRPQERPALAPPAAPVANGQPALALADADDVIAKAKDLARSEYKVAEVYKFVTDQQAALGDDWPRVLKAWREDIKPLIVAS
jgi:hypothetical protein